MALDGRWHSRQFSFDFSNDVNTFILRCDMRNCDVIMTKLKSVTDSWRSVFNRKYSKTDVVTQSCTNVVTWHSMKPQDVINFAGT